MQPPRVVISAGELGSLRHVLECARLVAPLDRISVVAAAHSAPEACRALAPYDGVELIMQLREQRGADVLLPLAQAFGVDPLATIVFLPPDLSTAEPRQLAAAIRGALTRPDRITIIGWTSSTFVAVGGITCFWDQLRAAWPRCAAVLECYLESMETPDEARMLLAAYEHLEAGSFSDVLAAAPSLDVVMLPAAVRARGSIPPTVADRPAVRAASVYAGLARISGPVTEAPTLIARSTRPIDTRAGAYRNGS
jgi:hypothetical protein